MVSDTALRCLCHYNKEVELEMSFEEVCCEILAQLVADVTQKKPDDPLGHMLDILCFPFDSNGSIDIMDPTLCRDCARKRPNDLKLNDVARCCTFQILGPFGSVDCFYTEIERFLNSNETLLVIVGDGRSAKNGDCDCSGSGKSRFCRWLDFPGRFIHRRSVVKVDSRSAPTLFRFLEGADEFRTKTNEAFQAQATLTLVDHVEPPHIVLHALLQHHYFRPDHCVRCTKCNAVSGATLHKTIIFTRPGVLFKFPVPCRVVSMVRLCKLGIRQKPQSTIASVSFGALVGPAHSTKRRVRFEEALVDQNTATTRSSDCTPFREVINPESVRILHKEIGSLNASSLDECPSFAAGLQSRCRVESLLATFLVAGLQSPKMDLSMFPELTGYLASERFSDVFVARMLQSAFHSSTSRQLVACLLCVVVASQQLLSPFSLAVTATEMLELYLHVGSDSHGNGPEAADAPSRDFDVLEILNLQNIVVEAVERPLSKRPSLVAQTLLDVRGTLIDYELLNLLLRGTSVRSSVRFTSPSSSSSVDLESQFERQSSKMQSESTADSRSYGHPVLLLSDVTDVGRHGFDGHALSQQQKNVNNAHSLFCFLVTLPEFGVPLVVSLDKYHAVARSTFARAADSEDNKDEQVLWKIHFPSTKAIVDAAVCESRLVMLLADGSAACVNLNLMRHGMAVSVSDVAPPSEPPNSTRRQNTSLQTNGSQRDSQACEKSIALVHRKNLECNDPNVLAISSCWVAAASHDSDIVCVVRDPFEVQDAPLIMQTEHNITCLCLVGDSLLVTGLETGAIQGFSLPEGREVFTLEHHEAQINVIKSTDPGPCAPHFIAGSEDATITVFCVDDSDPIRSMRFHSASVIDIVANHVHQNGVVVSADRSGAVMVWTLNPLSPKPPSVLWSSTFPGLRSICLSSDASWLVCTRVQNSPVALPIADWTREGTGRFHQKRVTALHITGDEKFLLTGGADGLIFVWDLNNSVDYMCSFQQHSLNSSINTISTSSDNVKVVSADAINLICLWKLQTGAIIRILQRSPGGGMARFIENDFLLLQTQSRGVKVFDDSERLFASSSQTGIGSIDVCFVPDDVFRDCLMNSSNDSEEEGERPSGPSAVHCEPLASSINPEHDRMRKQCFVGMTKGNEDSGVHIVSISCLMDLDRTLFELSKGEVEDEFGDEEELFHSDRITAFRFLQPRQAPQPSDDPDEAPPPPPLLLAATGAEDLTVILWNWARQQPLKMLQHTNFVTSCLFWYSSLGLRSSYPVGDLKFLSAIDPSFRQCRDGAVVCNLITAQYADSNSVSLRVFQVRENNRAFQKRLLMRRCGQLTTASNFPYNMLSVDEISTGIIPVSGGLPPSSVTCIAVRPTDGLLCTGDETCQVIFWRLSAIRTKKLIDLLHKPPPARKEQEYSDDEADDPVLKSLGEGASVGLVPIRRIASRL